MPYSVIKGTLLILLDLFGITVCAPQVHKINDKKYGQFFDTL